MRCSTLSFGLILLVFISAVAVVLARHQSRKLFAELQELEQQRDAMNEEWGQLQLEQATWGTHSRIEDVARHKLGMAVPPAEAIMVITP
jgi:cell division protein FtsL